MAQNRPAPAYQEYAASMLAKTEFRVSELSVRGLLYTLRLECWVNQKLPADPKVLGKILGLSAEEVNSGLKKLDTFFDVTDGWITCPEHTAYKAHLAELKQARSEGGRKGAEISNNLRAKKKDEAQGKPQAIRRGNRGSLGQHSSDQNSSAQLNTVTKEDDVLSTQWVEAYEASSVAR